METTVRFHTNSAVAERHNKREKDLCSKEKHIDLSDGIHEVWGADRTTAEAYEDIFGEALAEYNAKQKRKSRRMTMDEYMQSVEADTRGRKKTKRVKGKRIVDEDAKQGKKLCYEVVISAGNTDKLQNNLGQVMYDDDGHQVRPHELPYEVNRNACRRYYDTFEERNPHFKIIRADWHADEFYINQNGVKEWGTEHLHLEYIPVADGYKQGLSIQNAIGRALKQQGFTDHEDEKGKWVCAYEDWNNRESAYFEDIVQQEYAKYCETHPDYYTENGNLTIVHPVKGRKVENILTEEYRELQEIEEQKYEAKADLISTCSAKKSAEKDLKEARQKRYNIEQWVQKTEEYYDALLDITEADLKHKKKQMEDLYIEAENSLKTQNTTSDDDLSRKAFMQKIKYKDGTTAEDRYQAMLQQKQQEQERRKQNLQKQKNELLRHADEIIQNVENTDRFDTDRDKFDIDY